MKERTLNQTWVLCLRMWRAIAKKWKKRKSNVLSLKDRWLRDNGFGKEKIDHDCFFCDFNKNRTNCKSCPGKLIDQKFGCANAAYNYSDNPPAFYRELLRLNRIRKANK